MFRRRLTFWLMLAALALGLLWILARAGWSACPFC